MLAGSPQRSLGRCFLRGAFRIGSCLGVSDIFQMMADFFGSFDGDRTGVRLFFGYAKSRKKVNDGFCLDLEFAGEFIDTDLGCVTHASLGTFLFLLLRGSVGF
jgi:hypothetical protein